MEDTEAPIYPFLKSPYLPTTALTDTNQYIYLTKPADNHGRIEHSFIKIGGSFMMGGLIGLIRGFVEGNEAALGQRKYIRTTIIINHMVKRSTLANSLGLITLIYSGVEALLNETKVRKAEEVNKMVTGTTTGILYQSTDGLRKAIMGGLIGFSLSAVAVAWMIKNKLLDTCGNFVDELLREKLNRAPLEFSEDLTALQGLPKSTQSSQ